MTDTKQGLRITTAGNGESTDLTYDGEPLIGVHAVAISIKQGRPAQALIVMDVEDFDLFLPDEVLDSVGICTGDDLHAVIADVLEPEPVKDWAERIRPDEVLLIRPSREITAAGLQRMKDQIPKRLYGRVVIMDPELELTIVEKAVEASDG